MPRRENGEFEVLLGNKQLLSIFFIVVILLGVFFTMGYILGRNSAPAAGSSSALAKKKAPPPASQVQRPTQQEAVKDSGFSQPGQASPSMAGQAKPAQAAEAPVPAPPAPTEPAPGQTFLQVVAVKQPEAKLVADVLKQKGFRSLIAPSSTESLYRVLVGPLEDADALARTRNELETAGFKTIVRKY